MDIDGNEDEATLDRCANLGRGQAHEALELTLALTLRLRLVSNSAEVTAAPNHHTCVAPSIIPNISLTALSVTLIRAFRGKLSWLLRRQRTSLHRATSAQNAECIRGFALFLCALLLGIGDKRLNIGCASLCRHCGGDAKMKTIALLNVCCYCRKIKFKSVSLCVSWPTCLSLSLSLSLL